MGRRITPDLTGRRFGKLVVMSQAIEVLGGKRQSVCYCLCDCGNEISVAASHLQKADGTAPRNPTRSCGCAKTHGDLTGRRFGRLVVLREAASDKKAGRMWLCLCDCGNETISSASALSSGLVSSCGCLRSDSIAAFAEFSKTGARASHTPSANKKRTLTVYGSPGSDARKKQGAKLRRDLQKSGAILDDANIAKIAADQPESNNPYRGVCWNGSKHTWMAYCQVKGKRWQKVGFKTPEDAKEARDEKQRDLLSAAGLENAVEKIKKEKGACKNG